MGSLRRQIYITLASPIVPVLLQILTPRFVENCNSKIAGGIHSFSILKISLLQNRSKSLPILIIPLEYNLADYVSEYGSAVSPEN